MWRCSLVLVMCGALGCSGGEEACVADLPEACTPQYDPTFDEVWQNTLEPSCSLSGCHGGGSASGGLAMPDLDAAHGALVGGGYVTPGDASCSSLVDHLEPAGLGDMPPGAPLGESERCAVRQWIDAGADR
jgi:hypothetical protein